MTPFEIIPHIPVGEWVRDGVDWINRNLDGLLSWISVTGSSINNFLADMLLALPPIVMVLLFALFAWVVRSWRLALGVLLSFLLIISMGQWTTSMQTLALVLLATITAIVIAVPSTLLVVLIAALAAYAFAFLKFPGRDWLLIVVIILLAVPVQVALIPLAGLFGNIGIFGSIAGVVLFHVAFGLPFAIFLLRNFFIQFLEELLEAARVDGASDWSIFLRIILPLGLPAIASLSIFQFLWTWNDMLVALIFATGDSAPLTVAIQQQLRQFGSNIDVLSAGAFLSMIVPLIVFFAFQRYFVQALLAGSQK